MANLRIEVNQKDLKRLRNKLDNFEYFTKTGIQDIVYRNANLVVNEMKREVPVDTGTLKRNIEADRINRGVQISSEAIRPGNNYNYAPYIDEYGGRFSRGIFYFTNGINRFRDRVLKELRNGVKAILRSKTGATRQTGKVRTYTPRK